MSIATETSLRIVAVPIDGSLGGRARDSLQSTGRFMMGRFLEDRQRYDAIACGVPTVLKQVSPGQDIESMAKKIRMMVTSGPGGQKQ